MSHGKHHFECLLLIISTVQIACGENLDLLLFHSNNIYSYFEENEDGVGGAGRAMHILSKARRAASENNGPPVLYLNAGDNFQGSVLYYYHNWRIVTEFMNMLKPDVMCLGNHDFDAGVTNLTLFLRHTTFPVVGANIDVQNEKALIGRIKPYHLFSVKNRTIAIVGYTTKRTKITSFPGKIEFTDEVEAVKLESKKLRKMGVQIIIALGHAGADVDERIAKEVEEVDVVVGGHRKTWFASDTDVYLPRRYTRKDGKKVIVVYEPGNLQYLGMVKIRFDEEGDIDSYSGKPIHLHKKIPQVPSALQLLQVRKVRQASEVLGTTLVSLLGECEKQECNLGNLLVDAMHDQFTKDYKQTKTRWTSHAVAIINSGIFRKSINITKQGKSLNRKKIVQAININDHICTMDVTGRYLQQAFEQGASGENKKQKELLQISGLHLAFNFSLPKGSRLERAYIRCTECKVPMYEPLMRDELYGVITSSHIAKGADGHTGLSKNKKRFKRTKLRIIDVLFDYIKRYKVISPEIDDRLKIAGRSNKIGISKLLLIFLLIIPIEIRLNY